MPKISWTDDEVLQLTRLVKEGLSGGRIGQIMNRKRGAVIGKVHRIEGLTLARSKAKSNGTTHTDKGERITKKQYIPIEKWVTTSKPKPGKFFHETPPAAVRHGLLPGAGKCKWAFGYSGDWMWCPEDKMLDQPYCQEHHERSRAPYQPKRIRT